MVKHIGFIMDGNRRYGRKQNLTTRQAYQKGFVKFLEFVSLQVKYNITETSFFALSTDNYISRSIDELNALFDIIKEASENEELKNFFINNNIRISVRGDIVSMEKNEKKDFSKKKLIGDLKQAFESINEKITTPKFFVNLAVNYDGQKEIVYSFKNILTKIEKGELNAKSINEKTIKQNLWFNDSSAPDIIVRPGNAPRLSGFMLYESEYSEIYLTNKLWPELNEMDFIGIIEWFKSIKRNFGK